MHATQPINPAKRPPSFGPRLIATCVMGFLLVVLSSTLFAWWSVGPLHLDPLIVVVVAAGFRLPLLPGGLVVIFLGYLVDLTSGGVLGLQITAYLVVFCICAVAERQLEIGSWPFQMASVALLSLAHQCMVVGGLMLVHRDQLLPANLPWVLVSQAVLNALTAPLFFLVQEWLVGVAARAWPQEKKGL